MYDSKGVEQWSDVYSRDNNTNDNVIGLVVDSKGNIVAVSSGTFSDQSMLTVTKYSPQGNVLWRREINGGQATLMLDSSDNIFIAGRYVGRLDGRIAAFIIAAKITPTGEVVWSKKVQHETGHFYGDAALDPQGNMVIIVRKTTVEPYYHVLVNCLDPDGKFRWTTEYPISEFESASDASVVYDGVSSFIVGASLAYGTTSGTLDVGLVQYSLTGEVMWKEEFEARYQNGEVVTDIKADNRGSIYVVGYCTDGTGQNTNQFVVKYTHLAMSADDLIGDGNTVQCLVDPSIATDFAHCTISIPSYEIVTLRICDELGRVLIDYGSEIREAGEYRVVVPTSELPAGRYHAVAHVGSVVKTTSFIVIN